MAKQTGTATDYKDLLLQLVAFLEGSASPTSGLDWQVVREKSTRTSPDSSINGADIPLVDNTDPDDVDGFEFIFRGTGGVSPEADIYFGIKTYQVASSTLYNWEIRAFTGFADTSPETGFNAQTGLSPAVFLPLQNTTMDYWFWANSRRVFVVVKTGSAFHHFYAGFINPFATESEYPYPMCVLSSCYFESANFASTSVAVGGLPVPVGTASDGVIVVNEDYSNTGCGYIRWVDGTWKRIRNVYAQSGSDTDASGGNNSMHVQPTSQLLSTFWDTDNFPVQGSVNTFHTLFTAGTPGNNPTAFMQRGLGSPEPTPLFPLTLVYGGANAVVGEFDGVYWASSQGGITSEDIISDSGVSPEQDYLVFQNAWRTDPWQFLAVRDD